MKLLFVTQKIDLDDDLLGFVHGWILEFSKHFSSVEVICLKQGRYILPENVKVHSLGKEKIASRTSSRFLKRLYYLFRLFRLIAKKKNDYDAVFVHMNPEYVVLAGWLWKIWGKKIGLWYAHGHVSFTLKIAERFCDCIFTSTQSGCRLKSPKIKVVGQGINTDLFSPSAHVYSETLKLVSVGRISPVKDYETLIRAASHLVNENKFTKFQINIIGDVALDSDRPYFEELKRKVNQKGLESYFNFTGKISNREVYQYLNQADFFVNMSHTGSLDKAIAEAMSSGLLILTCNESLNEILGKVFSNKLIYPKKDFKTLADRIQELGKLSSEERKFFGGQLRQIIVENHSLRDLAQKIIKHYQPL